MHYSPCAAFSAAAEIQPIGMREAVGTSGYSYGCGWAVAGAEIVGNPRRIGLLRISFPTFQIFAPCSVFSGQQSTKMSDAHPNRNSLAVTGASNILKRKVRKGTQSCWECKRRKIRCTFAAPRDSICDGCRSRRTRCISQEFHEEAPLASRKADRLSRVEALVEQLVERNSADLPNRSRRDGQHQDEEPQSVRISRRNQYDNSLELPTSIVTHNFDLEGQIGGDLDRISHKLLAVWPGQHDLDLILSIPIGSSVLLHGLVCQPYSELVSGQVTSPRLLLQPPSRESHPVFIARKLLLLSSLLQGIPPCSVGELAGLSSDCNVMMSRVFNVVTRLVTSHDELINSIEGIECVMIESMYLNKAGNLRRAWLVNRKAMAMAQMLGLHTGTSSSSMFLEKETQDRIDPHYMWFRLVVSDRYLSLMLGLPQGSLETVFPNLKVLASCAATERMERMEVSAAGLILQRNATERTDLAATYKVDRILQEAAALMPPQWWLMPSNLAGIDGNDDKAFEESIRLTNQFAHHHLLLQLHLPYMMLPSSIESNYDYSKMTAASASRTIVGQFVAFRTSISSIAYCRGIDFIAFIASTTLCIAHIEARRQHEADARKSASTMQSLQHQRLSDRGLLERALEVMETMAQSNHDIVTQKISSILRPLLDIESNSSKGGCYHIYASSGAGERDSQSLGDTSEEFHELRIQIPYFGTVHIEHRPPLSNIAGPTEMLSEELSWNQSISQMADNAALALREPISPFDQDGEGGNSIATCQAAYEISTAQSANTDWQAVPSCLDMEGSFEQSGSADSMLDASKEQETYLLVPGLTADVDDWALQGVDMALFRNFTRSSGDSTDTR
ncbi:hypothetical protein F5Y13DRAFT_203344 [Hypoxylon sp. FL1857]|nr:hypothetical protein F5Y13DRAFT_203344 [Hypoxylon sp. FL1857]